MSDFKDWEAERAYRTLTRKQLFQVRAAFALDHAAAKHDETRTFCQNRMDLISRVIADKDSGQLCGCDPAENYVCERHERREVVR